MCVIIVCTVAQRYIRRSARPGSLVPIFPGDTTWAPASAPRQSSRRTPGYQHMYPSSAHSLRAPSGPPSLTICANFSARFRRPFASSEPSSTICAKDVAEHRGGGVGSVGIKAALRLQTAAMGAGTLESRPHATRPPLLRAPPAPPDGTLGRRCGARRRGRRGGRGAEAGPGWQEAEGNSRGRRVSRLGVGYWLATGKAFRSDRCGGRLRVTTLSCS